MSADQGVHRFRAGVARHLGLCFDDSKIDELHAALRNRVAATGLPEEEYLTRLEEASSWPSEARRLSEELTIGETYFFRNAEQLRALAEVALAARMIGSTSEGGSLRILSAGCASGEEPYSIAMVLLETLAEASAWNLELKGVDINPRALARAREGRYSSWSLRELPPAGRHRWFRSIGGEYLLDQRVRSMVTFEEANLADLEPALLPRQHYDAVFCRNVVMYLAPAVVRSLLSRIAWALTPGGYLFLGHAETLRGVSTEFHLRHTHGAFYYQLRNDPTAVELTPDRGLSAPPRQPQAQAWLEAIRGASQRIRDLAERPMVEAFSRPGMDHPGASLHASSHMVGPAVDLLRQERYEEALTQLASLPAGVSRTAEALLLRAVLLTHGGHLAQAESACFELLALEELSAGAHYLLALCREGRGDRRAAAESDQTASYLEPGFAMPRLHRGLLALRVGDPQLARSELRRALFLLGCEEPSRILLYGGGFGRESLMALCQGQLSACGGGHE